MEHQQLNWFTLYASGRLDELRTELATIQGSRHQSRQKWAVLREMLDNCHHNPILNIPAVTPACTEDLMRATLGQMEDCKKIMAQKEQKYYDTTKCDLD